MRCVFRDRLHARASLFSVLLVQIIQLTFVLFTPFRLPDLSQVENGGLQNLLLPFLYFAVKRNQKN